MSQVIPPVNLLRCQQTSRAAEAKMRIWFNAKTMSNGKPIGNVGTQNKGTKVRTSA